MLSGKPYFTLTVEADASVGAVLVNGETQCVLQFAPVRMVLPVNHWLGTGGNVLQAMLAPFDEEGTMGTFAPAARCSLTLKVRESGTGTAGDRTVASLDFDASDPTGIGGNTGEQRLRSTDGFSASDEGDVLVGAVVREAYHEVVAVLSRTVTLPAMGLPRWKFLDSDDLTGLAGPDIDARVDTTVAERLKGELLPHYRRIRDALDSGKVEDLIPLYAERCGEADAAFFHEPGYIAGRLAAAFRESVEDPGQKLCSISEDNTMLMISDNDKLARLCRNDRMPLIVFEILPMAGSRQYDAVFRKSGGKWILTR